MSKYRKCLWCLNQRKLSDLNQLNSQFPIKATSKRIRIFLNPHLFLSRVKNFCVHTCPYSNRICPPTRIRHHSSTQDSSMNICHRKGKELGSILSRHRINKYPDLASTRFRIHSAFQKFHSGKRSQKVADLYSPWARKWNLHPHPPRGFLRTYIILYFPIAHNTLCLPPKFCINHCF